MIIKRPLNNKRRGVIEFLVYKEGDSFVGVCLTFDIVEEGGNPSELMRSIKEAAELHLDTVIKNDLSDDLLNRYAPEEYWKKYFNITQDLKNLSVSMNNFPMVSPYQSELTAQIG